MQNVVMVDLETYTSLVIENNDMKHELDRLKFHVLPQTEQEVNNANYEIKMLKEELINSYIDRFHIENYAYEEVINVENYRFAITPNNRKKLRSLGITENMMVRMVVLEKRKYDEEHKGDEE